ncbi:MAG: AAA family ATPase, partial [Acidimicrobiales bacterium]
MRVTRLRLRNYRVYEDLELALPPGLVGIYGPNGGGKSCLLESVRWTLYGRSRTTNEEVRTSGVLADCLTEVEFEHEGHLYLVRRTITGANATVRAEARADGQQVAEGARDVSTYVQSILGMDDTAFRASVFAEQKQLAAFSDQAAARRRELVLRLLGITPLDGARDQARRDARAARDDHQRLRDVLPDLDDLRQATARAGTEAGEAAQARTEAAGRQDQARWRLQAAEDQIERHEDLRRTHELLVAEGRTARAEHDAAHDQVQRLERQLADLGAAAEQLAALLPEAEGMEDAEGRLRLVAGVVAARRALHALPATAAPHPPDEAGWEEARLAAEAAAARLAQTGGLRQAAEAELERAHEAARRSATLSGAADCPLCGQPLGEAFARVQAHRAAETEQCAARHRALAAEVKAADASRRTAANRAEALAAEVNSARRARAEFDQVAARREAAAEALARAEAAAGRPVADGEEAD